MEFRECRFAAGGVQPRTGHRVDATCQATMRRLGLLGYRLTVSELSRHGCKVDLVERPRAGEQVLLKFESMDAIEAEVRWVRDHQAGLLFEQPFHEAVFAMMVERLTGAR